MPTCRTETRALSSSEQSFSSNSEMEVISCLRSSALGTAAVKIHFPGREVRSQRRGLLVRVPDFVGAGGTRWLLGINTFDSSQKRRCGRYFIGWR